MIDCLRDCLKALTDEVRLYEKIITASQRQKEKDTETAEGSTAGTFSNLRGNTRRERGDLVNRYKERSWTNPPSLKYKL